MRARPDDPDQWKRNQLALATAVFVWFAGTAFVVPFIAIYVQELGVRELDQVALWAGITVAAAPLTSATLAPLWGVLADRVGKKVTIQWSLAGFTAMLGLMAIVSTPWEFLGTRVAMGLFGSFFALALAAVSVSNPPERVREGIGIVQSARVLGLAAGPLFGGLFADAVGVRSSFLVSVAFGVVAYCAVALMMAEPRGSFAKPSAAGKPAVPMRAMFTAPAFLSVFAILFIIRLTERTFDPIVPLLVARQDTAGLGVATTTGLIVSGGFLATSISSAWIGRVTRKKRVQRELLVTLGASSAAFLLLIFAQAWWHLLIMRAVIGLLLGAASTVGFSAAAEAISAERRGLGMGILGSGTGFGASLGALVGGTVGLAGLEVVFIVDAALFVVAFAAGFVGFRRVERAAPQVHGAP